MAPYWVFRDYLEDDRNVIREWIDEQPAAAQAAIELFLGHVAALEQLKYPHTRVLTGPCDGLIELRIKASKVQYRPLVCHGPGRGEITILMGAIERGGKIIPKSACSTALQRKQNIGREGQTCEHE